MGETQYSVGSSTVCGPIFPIHSWFCVILDQKSWNDAVTNCEIHGYNLYVPNPASVVESKNEIFMVQRALNTDLYEDDYWVGGDYTSTWAYITTDDSTHLNDIICNPTDTSLDTTSHALSLDVASSEDVACLKRLAKTNTERSLCEKAIA